MKRAFHSKTQGGFSLIELAIAFIIVGLLAVPLLSNYQIHKEREYRDQTYIAFQKMHSALATYVAENGVYPCPSDPSKAFNTPGHGESVANCWDTLKAANQCSGAMCHRGAGFIGGFPYVTLGMPYTDGIDGYKNFIRYVVGDKMVNPTLASTDRVGSLSLADERGKVAENFTNRPYGLISAGANKKGSYNIYGKTVACTTNTRDYLNCNNDSEFVQARINLSNSSSYFDDIVDFPGSELTSLWEISMKNPIAIYNTNPGTVGIGISEPDTDVRLDVAGDVKADQVRAETYCDQLGKNCMETEVIAGDITKCDAGEYLVAIVANEPVCEPIVMKTVKPKTCPTGQFVKSIDAAGNITCGAV